MAVTLFFGLKHCPPVMEGYEKSRNLARLS